MKAAAALDALRLRVADQPTDVRGMSPDERDRLIISTVRVDGRHVVLSRYKDDYWQLSGTGTNRRSGDWILDFTQMPSSYRDLARAVFYRYIRRGREGRSPPKTSTVKGMFRPIKLFLNFLIERQISSLSEASPFVCSLYVSAICEKGKGRCGRLGKGSLAQMFAALEMLHEFSQFTLDPMSHHPWQGTSAKHLAGMTGEHRPQRSSTPLMPDAVFTTLFQHAWQLIERAHYLLELRDKVARDAVKRAGGGKTKQGITTRRILAEEGYPGKKRDLNRELMDLRLACYIVVASVTGCRNHEIVFSQSNSCYQSVGEDGEVYWWLRSQSTKTEEGHTEWMIPEAGVTALMVMERWSKPYQKEVENEIRVRRASNPSDPEIAEASRHRRAVFLGFGPAKRVVRTLSIFRWNVELKVFAKKCGLDWRPATHQFRRKFANYAARSQFGDLRYLREHFKHWSQDMTNLYALNDAVEMELFLEIEREFGELKRGVVEKWFQEDERLAGGFGENIVAYRGSEDIKLFASRAQMIKSVSEGISIRSNGHAWCTADDGGGCVGNDVERSRCSGCNSAVIDSRHTRIYQGLYDHLKEVAKCDDIGTTGHARVERDLARCGRVLENLGCGLEEGLHEPTS